MTGTEGLFPRIDGDFYWASEHNAMVMDTYSDVKTYNLAVTTTTATIDLSGVNYKYTYIIRNVGTTDCYIDLDNTATTDGYYLPRGAEIILQNISFANISAITATGTTTLSIAVKIALNSKTGYKTNKEILVLNATAASSYVSFSDTSAYKDIIIINQGASAVYVAFGTTAAVTNLKLEPEDHLIVNTNKYQIAAICDTGLTATIKVLGVY